MTSIDDLPVGAAPAGQDGPDNDAAEGPAAGGGAAPAKRLRRRKRVGSAASAPDDATASPAPAAKRRRVRRPAGGTTPEGRAGAGDLSPRGSPSGSQRGDARGPSEPGEPGEPGQTGGETPRDASSSPAGSAPRTLKRRRRPRRGASEAGLAADVQPLPAPGVGRSAGEGRAGRGGRERHERSSRNERGDRKEGRERGERGERSERDARGERGERSERDERGERGERGDATRQGSEGPRGRRERRGREREGSGEGADGGRGRTRYGRRPWGGDPDTIEIVPQPTNAAESALERVLLVNARDREESRIALLAGGRLVEVFIESPDERSAVGNIYRGRIQNVERGIGAAFVDLGRGLTGFLHATDMPLGANDDPTTPPIDRMREGDEVIAQITRDGIGRKGPALTGRVSLPGRYLVLMPHAGRSGISRRIPEGRERQRVRRLLMKLEVPAGMGVIVRTASETTDVAALQADLTHLVDEWGRIQRRAAEPGAPGVLRGESDLAERSVRDIMPADVTKIVVDREEIAGQIHRLLKVWYPSEAAAAEAVGQASAREFSAARDAPRGEIVGRPAPARPAADRGATDEAASDAEGQSTEDAAGARADLLAPADPSERADRSTHAEDGVGEASEENEVDRMARLRTRAGHMPIVEIHTDAMPLFHAYDVESQLEDAYRRAMRLPSGGSIVIDPTEALVAIDVNSGRLTDEVDPERTALVTNLEAVEEVARQLRLRDLGGLIVVDFIDMRMRASIKQVELAMQAALGRDRARIRLGRLGPFGLVLLSRQRIRPALTQSTQEACDACGGTGRRRHAVGAALRILREVQARLARSRGRGGLEVRAPSGVVVWLKKNRSHVLRQLERGMTGALVLVPDEGLGRDGWAMKGLPGTGAVAGTDDVEDES